MITDFLLDHSALAASVLALVAVVGVGAGYLLLRTRRYGHRILWVLALLFLVPVVALTLVPTSGRAYEVCAIQFYLPTFGTVELWANVALFFPPVFFASLATRRPLPMLAAGAALSALIEAIQALVPAIGRACDTNDWAMNTAGTAVAVLLAAATIALADRNSPDRASRGV